MTGTVHVENVLSKMDFEPEIFQHDVEKNEDGKRVSFDDIVSPVSLHYDIGHVTHRLDLSKLPAYNGAASPPSAGEKKEDIILQIVNRDSRPLKS